MRRIVGIKRQSLFGSPASSGSYALGAENMHFVHTSGGVLTRTWCCERVTNQGVSTPLTTPPERTQTAGGPPIGMENGGSARSGENGPRGPPGGAPGGPRGAIFRIVDNRQNMTCFRCNFPLETRHFFGSLKGRFSTPRTPPDTLETRIPAWQVRFYTPRL